MSSLRTIGTMSSFFLACTCFTSLQDGAQKPEGFCELLGDPSSFLLSLDLDRDLSLLLGFDFGSPLCLEVEADCCCLVLSLLLSLDRDRDLECEFDGDRYVESLDLESQPNSEGDLERDRPHLLSFTGRSSLILC